MPVEQRTDATASNNFVEAIFAADYRKFAQLESEELWGTVVDLEPGGAVIVSSGSLEQRIQLSHPRIGSQAWRYKLREWRSTTFEFENAGDEIEEIRYDSTKTEPDTDIHGWFRQYLPGEEYSDNDDDAIPEDDILVYMPPKRTYKINIEVKGIRKAEPIIDRSDWI